MGRYTVEQTTVFRKVRKDTGWPGEIVKLAMGYTNSVDENVIKEYMRTHFEPPNGTNCFRWSYSPDGGYHNELSAGV